MLAFFEKMLEEEKKIKANEDLAEVNGLLSFLSTHPATEARIEVLKTKIAALSIDRSYISFDLNFDAFKHSVQQEQRSEEDTEHAE
jgi:predicted Zn-dependent protease